MSQSKLKFEERLWEEGYQRVMGLDEVGRGCISGPVVAAGVIFRPGERIYKIRDSKLLNAEDRLMLSERIKERALFWTVKWCMPDEIDELNIFWASIKAMQRCTEVDGAKADYLLVDGRQYGTTLIPHTCIVEGDNKSMTIGAASILAKVYRDEWMAELHEEYPQYGWCSNAGYATREHLDAVMEHGISPYHRRSFVLRTSAEGEENGTYIQSGEEE